MAACPDPPPYRSPTVVLTPIAIGKPIISHWHTEIIGTTDKNKMMEARFGQVWWKLSLQAPNSFDGHDWKSLVRFGFLYSSKFYLFEKKKKGPW